MIVPLGFALPTTLGRPEQLLAIVGGAAVGAFVFGLLAQVLCRAMTRRKLPAIPTNVVRIAGGLLVGLLTALWVWQGGGWGPGGPGGGGPGGTTADNGKPKVDNGHPNNPNQPSEVNKPPPASVLRLEVLMDDAVRQAAGGGAAGDQAVKDRRFYRVVGETSAQDLQTLDKMKERIKQRLGEQPPLTEVDIVTRPDSPDRSAGRVVELSAVIFDLNNQLKVDYPPQ